MPKMTTIQISEDTKDKLKDFGRIGDTYEEAITLILDRLAELEEQVTKKESKNDPREAASAL